MSARKAELLEAAYRYVLEHGLGDMSLRPLAAAVGSSPRVLLFLFGSKEGLIRELIARSRVDELAVLDRVRGHGTRGALIDLLATGDVERVTAAVLLHLETVKTEARA